MDDEVRITTALSRWTGGQGGNWYLATIAGAAADAIAGHALMRRLELGRARGFGSVRVRARIGDTCWHTSVFPQKTGGWVMLVKAAVRKAEGLGEGDPFDLALELL